MVASSLSDSQAEALLAGAIGSGDLESVAGVLAAVRELARPGPEADFLLSLLLRRESHA